MLVLTLLADRFAVCRLSPEESIPAWALSPFFFSITKTEDELSVVCMESMVPLNVKAEKGWRVFKLEGPFPFTLTGVLASVANPLASAGVSIFAVATFDTDYVLVKESQLDLARQALESAGHLVKI